MSRTKLKRSDYKALLKESDALHADDKDYKHTLNFEFVMFLIIVLCIAVGLRLLVFEPTKVEGDSMFPTLLNGERMFVEKVSFIFEEPQRGQIIICRYPDYDVTCVKRVVGLPGDTIQVMNGFVYVNGEQLDESQYWNGTITNAMMFPVTVGENELFVMGDNRNASDDSRNPSIGAIPYSRVIGRARAVMLPYSDRRPL